MLLTQKACLACTLQVAHAGQVHPMYIAAKVPHLWHEKQSNSVTYLIWQALGVDMPGMLQVDGVFTQACFNLKPHTEVEVRKVSFTIEGKSFQASGKSASTMTGACRTPTAATRSGASARRASSRRWIFYTAKAALRQPCAYPVSCFYWILFLF
ncbi:uncharacterized protein LOC117647130 isoform X1 [Thrips palmi]|uniref:Uncharacterized protein LOC117647130 isoform X1 n=1 Tax=Thrips palmi TaxID=161013 RepID=A0A6P8ZPR5_THRPL|nr:uncharacterized protein LOC117647130 isoform X1 [Thrips palmi]